MEEYAGLLKLGFAVALVLLVGLVLRLMGFGKKKAKNGNKAKGKAEKEAYFQQDAYVDMGGDGGKWEDSDMYGLKEGLTKSRGIIDDDDDDDKEKKVESWDDY